MSQENIEHEAWRSPDCWREIDAKLAGPGLPRVEIHTIYAGRPVVSGLSLEAYLYLLSVCGTLEERDGVLFARPIVPSSPLPSTADGTIRAFEILIAGTKRV